MWSAEEFLQFLQIRRSWYAATKLDNVVHERRAVTISSAHFPNGRDRAAPSGSGLSEFATAPGAFQLDGSFPNFLANRIRFSFGKDNWCGPSVLRSHATT